MKTIKITKMQGCGNDFVVLDYSEFEKSGLTMSELAKKNMRQKFWCWCRRNDYSRYKAKWRN